MLERDGVEAPFCLTVDSECGVIYTATASGITGFQPSSQQVSYYIKAYIIQKVKVSLQKNLVYACNTWFKHEGTLILIIRGSWENLMLQYVHGQVFSLAVKYQGILPSLLECLYQVM